MRKARLHFWLLMMDATNWLDRRTGWAWTFSLYLWCIRRASDATDWETSDA